MNAIAVNAPTCEARVGSRVHDFGFGPLWCNTRIGLRTFRDRKGIIRHYCAAPEHRALVVLRYGQASYDWDARKAVIDAAILADPERPS